MQHSIMLKKIDLLVVYKTLNFFFKRRQRLNFSDLLTESVPLFNSSECHKIHTC